MPLSHPLVPISLLSNRRYMSLVACATVCSMIYYSINIIWPGQISALFTTDSMEVGWLSVSGRLSQTHLIANSPSAQSVLVLSLARLRLVS